MSDRRTVLLIASVAKTEILRAYVAKPQFGHDLARRYIYEVAEAVASHDGREQAAAMTYEIADAIVGKMPLPDALFKSIDVPRPTAPPEEKNAGRWERVLAVSAAFVSGASLALVFKAIFG
jgi:hypothetical protein